MFKRLTKARRHSADEIGSGGGVLPTPLNLHEQPTGRKNSEGQIVRNGNGTSYVFANSRAKFSRKSCGDAYALLSEDDTTSMQPETDYRLVTAMPAFIVEHEPEKQKGLSNVWGLRRMSKKIDSFRRSGSRETICGTIPEHQNNNKSSADLVDASEKKPPLERRFLQNSTRSPSPFKSFFIRMGSTGMLNSSSKSRRASQQFDDPQRTPEKENLFRSCSTSQLNTSPTYVKGDDPSEGIDLRITAKTEKTVSCDNLNKAATASSTPFVPCDFAEPRGGGDFMRKSSSCDFKEAKKTNFPYAFLRSRLSVLPEERNYNGNAVMNGSKEDRLFKTASEEHFPAMKIEEASFEGTTTLGRRRTSKNGYPGNRDSTRYRMQDPSNRYARNSYSEDRSYENKESRYFTPMSLAMMQSGFEENCRNSISLPYQTTTELDYDSPNSGALLRGTRRNSSGEQRLSSHYVSSNESGYDSDGPRGESGEPHKCSTTDSSDTSSVVDSELEKPMRSSTPSEETAKDETLVWNHQPVSGRILPSVNQTTKTADAIQASAHRMRLQQDKTRFLTDIIQPPKRTRRCRLVSLSKTDPKESLGIRLAQQRHDEVRYVIVQLEAEGIAHRDGRLRLGDEIVEVEGKDLRTLNSLEEVQDFLRSCEGTTICLKTVYEETVPQIYLDEGASDNNRQTDTPKSHHASTNDCSTPPPPPAEMSKKQQPRPDYLPLDSTSTTTTRHVARFEKGLGKPSLGFSVVGGRDSPRGEMGIFVRRVFPGGQADVSKALFQGDEILSLNGKVLRGCTHQEVIELFKAVREGVIELELARRHRYHKVPLKTAPY